MIKQTKGAIKFLIAQYRAVLKKALLASLAFTFPAIAMQTIENTGLHDNSENTVIFEEYGQTVIDDDVTLTTPTNDNYYNYFALDYVIAPITYSIKSLTIKRTDYPETLQEDYPRRVGLYVRSDAELKSDITVDNGAGLTLNNNSKIVGNVTVNGFKNLSHVDEGPGGKLFMHATEDVFDESGQYVTGKKPGAATATIEGNIINNNGSVDVSSDDETYSRASTTLNLTGDYTQTNGVSSVSSDFADATATLNVNGNYSANGGGIWIGISKGENDRHLEEGREVSLGNYNSVLNIGKDLKVSGTDGYFQVMETGDVNVKGNATIDSLASADTLNVMNEDMAEEDGVSGFINGNLIFGKFNVTKNLTVGGQGITVTGEKSLVSADAITFKSHPDYDGENHASKTVLAENSTIKANTITVQKGASLHATNKATIDGNLILQGDAQKTDEDEDMNKGYLHVYSPVDSTVIVTGNVTLDGGSVYVDGVGNPDKNKLLAKTGSETLIVNGNYVQHANSVTFLDEVHAGKATLDVKKDFVMDGRANIRIGDNNIDTYKGTAELKVGGNLNISGTDAYLLAYKNSTVSVAGNASITSTKGSDYSNYFSNMVKEDTGVSSLTNGNIITGKMTVGGSLEVAGQGITIYGNKGSLSVGGDVKTSSANSIYLQAGGSFTGTKAAMLTANENEKNSNIAKDTFNVDASSVVHVTGVDTITNQTVQAIRSEMFATDSGILSFDGANYTDAPEEQKVSFDDAKEYAGTNALAGKEVIDVPDNITGSHNWGNATLASGKETLSLGENSGIVLDSPKGNNFVNTASGETGSVELANGAQISLKGSGAIKDVTGSSGTLIVDSDNNKASSVTAETINVSSIKIDNNSSLEAKSLTADNLNLKNSSVSADEIEIKKSADLENSSLTANNNLTVNSGSTFSIVKSSLNLKNLTLKGRLLLDPSYLYAENGIDLSNGGSLAILKDSVVGNGITSSDYDKSSSGANLYIGSQLSLGSSSDIYLNGNLENAQVDNNENYAAMTNNTDAEVYIDSNSTLYVDSSVAETGAAITGASKFTVTDDGTAKIVISGKVKAQDYIITDTASDNVKVGNDASSLATVTRVANFLYKAVESDNNGTVKLEYDGSKAAALSGISNSFKEGILNQAKASGFDSTQNNGLGLLQQMFEKIGTGSSSEISKFRDEANSVTGFIFGGVPLLNELVAQIAHDNVEQHNGFTTTGANHAAVKGTNATVWAMPFYKHSKSDSFKIEGSTYGLKAKIYGLSMGTDFEVADGFRLGFDGIVGHAKTDSKGSLDPSKDDASFWGIGTYGSYSYENLKIMADIGYTAMSTDTDLHTSYGTLSANNTKSYTFTTGVNAKYNFALTYADVAPHVGIRYNHANIDKYKVKRQGNVMLTGDSISQNYFQFPIGVEVSKQFACGEWNLKPMFDLTATINTGDKKLDAKTTLTGFDNTYGNVSTNAEVLDPVSVRGSLGLEAKYGSLGMGVGYSYTGSKNVKDHVFAAGVNYTF